MTIDAILTGTPVGTVGKPLTLSTSGDPAGEPRWYLESAPAASALDTLGNMAARYKTREQIRLDSAPTGGTAFTPDAPGRYVVAVYDVRVTTPVPHFGGQQLAGPTDNELTDAALTTAVAWVAETRSRTIGVQPDTATLAVTGYDNTILPALGSVLANERASLTPALRSGPAALAAQADDVLTVMDAIRDCTDISANLVLSPANLATAIGLWNAHLGRASGFAVHGNADSMNTAPSVASDTSSALVLLNGLKAALNAHRSAGPGTIHIVADAAHEVTAPDASDFASAVVLWTDLRDQLRGHGEAITAHLDPDMADGAAGEWFEAPRSVDVLPAKANALRAVYEAHRQATVQGAPHANADADNAVTVSVDSVPALIATVNAWADSIERHTANLANDGTAASAYHHDGSVPTPKPLKIPMRATDLQTAQRAAELCLLAFEAHALGDGNAPHGAATWGRGGVNFEPVYCVRLARAWQSAVHGLEAPAAAGLNPGFAALVALEGWT